jgi:hypothetical protein
MSPRYGSSFGVREGLTADFGGMLTFLETISSNSSANVCICVYEPPNVDETLMVSSV